MSEKKLFSLYYEKNKNAITHFALKLTKNKVDAADLVQESLYKSFKSFRKFDKTRSFKSWMFTIIKNTFVTRYHRRKKMTLIQDHVDHISSWIDRNLRTYNHAEQKLRVEYLQNSITHLPEKTQKPIKLFVSGYRYKEISEMLEIPMGTVKSRINYARKKLEFLRNKKTA